MKEFAMALRIHWLAILALTSGSRSADAQTLGFAFDAYAEALTTVQDLTEDGIPELVLAGRAPVSTYSHNIVVQLRDGGSGGLLAQTSFATSSGSWRVSIANVGDMDGDGAEEFAVGDAAQQNPPPFFVFPLGVVKIYNSRSFLAAPAAGLVASFGSFSEPGIDTQFGWSVAGVGDQDGDGLDDLAVGAPRAKSDRGRVEVVGLQTATPGAVRLIASHLGSNPADRFGEAIAGLGTYDCSDARPDFAVGLPGVQRVRVFAGPAPTDLQPPWPLVSFVASLANMDLAGSGARLLAIGAPGDVCPSTLGSRWAVRHNTGCGTGNYVQFESSSTSCLFPLPTRTLAGFFGDFCGPNCFGSSDCLFNVIGGVVSTTPAPNGYAVVSHFLVHGNNHASYCFYDKRLDS